MKTLTLIILVLAIHSNVIAQNLQIIPLNPEHKDLAVYKCISDESGNLWIATDKGLLEYNGTEWIMQVSGYVNKIFIDSQGRKWFSDSGKSTFGHGGMAAIVYSGGLHMLDKLNKVITDFDEVIKSSVINDICEAKNGNILVATGEKNKNQIVNKGGVFMYDGEKWTDLYKEKIVKIKFIERFHNLGENIWLVEKGMYNNGLIRYNMNEFIDISSKREYPNDHFYKIFLDNEGNTWFGGRNSIFNITKEDELVGLYNVKIHNHYPILKNYLENIYINHADKFLIYNNKDKTWDCPKGQLQRKNWIKRLYVLPDSSVWLFTKKGEMISKNGVVSNSDILKGKDITIVYPLKDGTLLCGTKGSGMYLYKKDELIRCEKDSFGNELPLSYSNLQVIDILRRKNNAMYLRIYGGILKIQND